MCVATELVQRLEGDIREDWRGLVLSVAAAEEESTIKSASLWDRAVGSPVTATLQIHATLRVRSISCIDNVKNVVALVLS